MKLLAAAVASGLMVPAAQAVAPPCEACHGPHGEGAPAAHVPRLTGQSADYLQKQLDDYARGTRDNPIMVNFAKVLNEAQRRDYAQRYATMSAPFAERHEALDAVQLARGHQLAHQGDEARQVQACVACHGPDGSGVPHMAPYIAGQSAHYIASALRAFQQGTRRNDAGETMRSVAARLTDADIVAVSGYFAQISIGGGTSHAVTQ